MEKRERRERTEGRGREERGVEGRFEKSPPNNLR